MIDAPAVAWDVSAFELAAAAVMFVVGTILHEAMHIGALEALREPYSVNVLPNGIRGGLFGTMVDIQLESMPARWRVATVMLAPLVMAMPPLAAYAIALTYPVVDAGTVLVLALWFIAAIPSLHDIVTVAYYRPTRGMPAEVSA